LKFDPNPDFQRRSANGVARWSSVFTTGVWIHFELSWQQFFDFSHATRREYILGVLENAKTNHNTLTHPRNERDHARLVGGARNLIQILIPRVAGTADCPLVINVQQVV
jgi:hypothetical protein